MNRIRITHPLWLVILFFGFGSFLFSVWVPPLENPDEQLNYENIRYIVDNRSLPKLEGLEQSKAHQAPLYYVIGAILTGWVPNEQLDDLAMLNPYWKSDDLSFGFDNKAQYAGRAEANQFPYKDASLGIHLLRWVSILFGIATIVAVYATARRLSNSRPIALLAAILVGWNPMFLSIQSSVHNDALINLWAAVTIYLLVRYWQSPSVKGGGWIGLSCGLGIITKITFLFLGPTVAVIFLVRAWLDRDQWKPRLGALACATVTVIGTSGWWFVRNYNLYDDPTAMSWQKKIWQPRMVDTAGNTIKQWGAAIADLPYFRDSFWGAFGFGQITLPPILYTILFWLICVATALFLFRIFKKELPNSLLIGLLLIAPLTAVWSNFDRMATSSTANFGRYLFTTYAVLATIWAIGFGKKRLVSAVLASGFAVLNLFVLFGVIRPTFYPNTQTKQIIEQSVILSYDQVATLVNMEIPADSYKLGDTVPVHLTWHLNGATETPLSQFVQLVDPMQKQVGGRDTYHSNGRYPSHNWRPNTTLYETVYIPLKNEPDRLPTALHLDLGLVGDNGRIVADNGNDTHTLTTIRIGATDPSPYASAPALYQLGEDVELIKSTDPQVINGQLKWEMVWRAKRDMTQTYSVFVHLFDDAGNQIPLNGDRPADPSFPSALWQAGDVVMDERTVALPELATGAYTVYVGWYALQEPYLRLPIEGTPNDAIEVGKVVIP